MTKQCEDCPYNTKSQLTERQKEVLKLIFQGDTSKEIAIKLHISKRTVDGHRNEILSKFGAKNTMHLLTIMPSIIL